MKNLGPHEAMILRNHGLLTCGATIPQAFNTMYQLELACRTYGVLEWPAMLRLLDAEQKRSAVPPYGT